MEIPARPSGRSSRRASAAALWAILALGCAGAPAAGVDSVERVPDDAASSVAAPPTTEPTAAAAAADAPLLPPTVDDEEFTRAMGRSVFLLEILGEEDRVVANATAFCIGPSRVLTVWHAIEFSRKARIRTDDGETFPVKGLLAHEPEQDLALLLVDLPEDRFRPLVLAAAPPAQGDRVCLVAAPFIPGEGCSPSYGVVLGDSFDPARFRARVPAAPGWSGAPLLDAGGEVTGIAGAGVGPTTIATGAGSARALVEGATDPGAAVPLEKLTPRGEYGKSEEPVVGRKRLPIHLMPAVQAFVRGDLDAAEKSLTAVLKENPKDADAWEMLAVIEDKRGRVEQAIEALRKLRELRFDDSQAWYLLGHALQTSGRHHDAVEALAGAVARNPKNRDALYGLGFSHNALQQWDDAIAAWKRVLEIDPSYAAAQKGITYAEAMRRKK